MIYIILNFSTLDFLIIGRVKESKNISFVLYPIFITKFFFSAPTRVGGAGGAGGALAPPSFGDL